ncbi:MAG: lysophospholipase [Leptospira sp.]|nr:lysophospholipase [Leptospira sp.]
MINKFQQIPIHRTYKISLLFWMFFFGVTSCSDGTNNVSDKVSDLPISQNIPQHWESFYSREEDKFLNKDGAKLYYQVFRPKAEAKKVLVVHHGFGEHGGRYLNLVDALAETGYIIYLIDARGHGRSDGERGVVGHFSDFFADLKQLIDIAKHKENVNKVTLMGHSMGAVITFLYASTDNYQDDLNGLVTSGLAIKVKTDFVMKIKKIIGALLATSMPTLTLNTGLDVNMLSHDKSVVEAYINDPLFHDDISTYLGDFLLNSYEPALLAAGRITIPIYMFHGKEDQVALFEGTIDAFENVASKDKTMKIFAGLFHATMNETPDERKIVFKALIEWLDKH